MKMSPYMNQSVNIDALMAEARAIRARMIGDALVNGARIVAAKIGAGFAHVKAAQKQRAAMAQLMAMDERMLQDIGLNRALVPFAVGGVAENKAADLYADAGVGISANANDNGLRHAA
jgi:uncharacterized protein YjiS (DUF1127 family)